MLKLQNIGSIFTLFLFLSVQGLFAQSNDLKIADEYYSKADYEKAALYYDKVAKKKTDNLTSYYENYLISLQKESRFSDIDKWLKKLKKTNTENLLIDVDYAINKKDLGKEALYEQELALLMDFYKINEVDTRKLATILIKRDLYAKSVQVYTESRQEKQNDYVYALELANLYSLLKDEEKMNHELLNSLVYDEKNLEYVQNFLQNKLTTQDAYKKLLPKIYEKVNEHSDLEVFNSLLVWYYLQQNDFYNAFVEARAIDRKNLRLRGKKLIELGDLAINNKEYDQGIEIYNYVIDRYPNDPSYVPTKKKIIEVNEIQVKSQYPVDTLKVNVIIADYDKLLLKTKNQNQIVDIIRSKALLHANYLENYAEAIKLLNGIGNQYRISNSKRAEIKIDLGDIHILTNEPWESTLYYYQAERLVDDTPISQLAKFKNAKLSYYQGDFELSKERLDILKRATSREIANDALALSLLIADNLNLDTSDAALKQYAQADLYLYQNNITKALNEFDELLKTYHNHSLTDEVLFEKAKVYVKLSRYEDAVKALEKIVLTYKTDILGDDATYMLAEIYQYNLNNSTKGMDFYKQILLDYPGSIYTAESRKRFRILRGDKL